MGKKNRPETEPRDPAEDSSPPSEQETNDSVGVPGAPGAVGTRIAPLAPEASLEQKRAFLVASGVLHPDDAEHTDLPDIDALLVEYGARAVQDLEGLSPDATLEERRAYLVGEGTLTAQEAEALDSEAVDRLLRELAGHAPDSQAPLQTAPERAALQPPRTAPTDAERIEQQLSMIGREGAIALVSEHNRKAVAEVANLSTTELRDQARLALVERLVRERAAQAKRPVVDAVVRPQSAEPYGGQAPQHYALRAPFKYMHEGQLVDLPAGAVINETTHDIEALTRYGAQLIKCDPPAVYVR